MRWEKLFEPHILQRGYAYYQEGAVTDLNVKGCEIHATVEGTEDYEVTIDLDGDKVSNMKCTCPYAEDGSYCKHMAAVLYAHQYGTPSQARSTVESANQHEWNYDELKSAVDAAESVHIRKVLTDILWNEPKYRLKFLSMIHSEQEPDNLQYAKIRLAEIVDEAEGYDGFIDYYAASDFISEFDQWIEDEVDQRVACGQDRAAFELSTYAMETLSDVEMDDSDGGITEVAGHCYHVWETILDRGDARMEQEMFDFFLHNIDGQLVDYLEEYYESILMERFDKPEYLEQKLALYQMYLKAVDPTATDWSAKYHAERYLKKIFILLKQLNRPKDEITAFTRQYWASPFVRKAYMEELRNARRWDELIAVLKESIVMDADSRGSVRDYHIELKNTYRQIGNSTDYQRELWTILTQVTPGDRDIFLEYKQLIPQEEWPAKREEIFSSVSSRDQLNRLYSEEKLYDRLLKNVLDAPGLFALRSYESELVNRYPKEILDKYTAEINAAAHHAAGRSAYQDWVKTLRHMRKILGGREAVQQLVAEWRILYRNRRAMMEELNRL